MMVADLSIRSAGRPGTSRRAHAIQPRPLGSSPPRPGRLARALLGLLCAMLLPTLAWAQAEPTAAVEPPAPVTQPSVIELKAAAYDAQQKAQAAAADAERVRAELAEAERAARAAPPPVPVVQKPGATAEEVDALAEAVRQAQKDADAARAEAEQARREAREARLEFEAFKTKHALRFARKGLFISANVFYAPEIFDTRLSVEDGQGLGLALGYRISEHFELSLQGDRVTGFEFSGPGIVGEVQGWTATANAKVFILTGSFQPFVGMGIGAFRAILDAHDGLGNRSDDAETAVLFKVNAGFDYYISERLAVTADAAVYLPGGKLSALTFSTLGGGLKLRF